MSSDHKNLELDAYLMIPPYIVAHTGIVCLRRLHWLFRTEPYMDSTGQDKCKNDISLIKCRLLMTVRCVTTQSPFWEILNGTSVAREISHPFTKRSKEHSTWNSLNLLNASSATSANFFLLIGVLATWIALHVTEKFATLKKGKYFREKASLNQIPNTAWIWTVLRC